MYHLILMLNFTVLGRCDTVMEMVMKNLSLTVPPYQTLVNMKLMIIAISNCIG